MTNRVTREQALKALHELDDEIDAEDAGGGWTTSKVKLLDTISSFIRGINPEPASEPRAIQVGDTVRLRAIGSVGKVDHVDHVSDAKPGTLKGSFPFHVRWDLRTPRNGFIENWYSAEQLELVSDPSATSSGGEAT